MTASGIRAAVIGCGRMGTGFGRSAGAFFPPGWEPLSHAEAIAADSQFELRALCDPDPERLDAARTSFPGKNYYDDAAEMLAQDQPGLISIATRTAARPSLVELASQSGVRAIHLEKPLATSLAESKKIVDAINERSIIVSYGTTRRYMDVYRRAKALINSGTIGNLEHIAVENGRETLLWGHPHSVDLILFLADTQEVDYVQGNLSFEHGALNGLVLDSDPRVESATIRFATGVVGQITQTGGTSVRVSGSEGIVTVLADGSELTVHRRGIGSAYFTKFERVPIDITMSGTQRAIYELGQALANTGQPAMTSADVLINQRVLLSIARSSTLGGRRIALGELEDQFTVTGRIGQRLP